MVTIGIDAHKRSWVAVAVDEAGRVLGTEHAGARQSDAIKLYAWARTLAAADGMGCWGIEGAMHFGRPLAQYLVARGIRVVEVPGSSTARERRRSRGRDSEKSDVTDATAIARVALRDGQRLPPIGLDGEPARCRALSEHRDNLVLARTAALNQLYAHLGHTHPAEIRPFQARRNRAWLAQLATRVPPRTHDALADARLLIIQQLAALIGMLDAQIRQLDRELVALASTVAPTLLRIHGLAELSAAKIVGIVGHIDRFPTAARFASYAGVAPIEASSGDRQRHRLNRRGNRQLNRVLHIVALVQRRRFPPARKFVAKKVAEGKSAREALRALTRHLANVVFRALCQDQQIALELRAA